MKRLSLFAAMALGAFWLAVWLLWRGSAGLPETHAFFRGEAPGGATEAVWRYTGRRPEPEERLVLYGRQGSHYPAHAIVLEAFLGPRGGPPMETEFSTAKTTLGNYLRFQQFAVPPWDAGSDLFVGGRWPQYSHNWWEQGSSPRAPLEGAPWIRGKGGKFTKLDEPILGMVDVKIVPKSGAPASPGEYHFPPALRGSLASAGGGWAGVLALGLLVLRGRRLEWIAYNLFLGLLFWEAAGAIRPTPYLWQGSLWGRLDDRAFWGGLAAVQLATFPPLARFVARAWVCGWRRLCRRPRLWLAGALVLGTSCGVLWLCSRHFVHTTYGDGWGPLSWPGYCYHNPLAVGFYRVVREVFWACRDHLPFMRIMGVARDPGILDVRIIPYYNLLFAPLYLGLLWGIAREIGRTTHERVAAWLALLTAKTILLLFGYVELYPSSLPLMALALWLLLRCYLRHKDVVLSTSMSFVAYLYHLGVAPMLPVLGFLWLRRMFSRGAGVRWVLPRLGAVFVFALVAWLTTLMLVSWLKQGLEPSLFRMEVPRMGFGMLVADTAQDPQVDYLHWSKPHIVQEWALGSLEQASQYGGAVLFILGPTFLLWALAVVAGARRWTRKALGLGFTSSAILFVVHTGMLNSGYPYPKDWDLLSGTWLATAVSFAVLSFRLHALPRSCVRWAMVAIVSYQAWTTAMWVIYNLTCGLEAWEKPYVFY